MVTVLRDVAKDTAVVRTAQGGPGAQAAGSEMVSWDMCPALAGGRGGFHPMKGCCDQRK